MLSVTKKVYIVWDILNNKKVPIHLENRYGLGNFAISKDGSLIALSLGAGRYYWFEIINLIENQKNSINYSRCRYPRSIAITSDNQFII